MKETLAAPNGESIMSDDLPPPIRTSKRIRTVTTKIMGEAPKRTRAQRGKPTEEVAAEPTLAEIKKDLGRLTLMGNFSPFEVPKKQVCALFMKRLQRNM